LKSNESVSTSSGSLGKFTSDAPPNEPVPSELVASANWLSFPAPGVQSPVPNGSVSGAVAEAPPAKTAVAATAIRATSVAFLLMPASFPRT
jgi:hypothetical protein